MSDSTMNPDDMNPDEFDELIGKMMDGHASDSDLQRIESLLSSSAEFREIYRNHIEVHASLAWQRRWQPLASTTGLASRKLKEFTDVPVNDVAAIERSTWPIRSMAILALAACLIVAFVVAVRVSRRGDVVAENDPRSSNPIGQDLSLRVSKPMQRSVAKLGEAINARWEKGAAHFPGDSLRPGWLKLVSGKVRIDFVSGARVVVEGPAKIEIRSDWEAYLESGSLSCEVEECARGFRIKAKGLDVIDLGTRFGLRVGSEQEPEVHVFDGKVSLAGEGKGDPIEVIQNEAMQVVDGSLRAIEYSEDGFTTVRDLSQDAIRKSRNRFARWQAAAEALSQDPATLVHYTLADFTRYDTEIVNRAVNAQEGSDGFVIGCRPAEGRWPDKKAIELRGNGDRILLSQHGSVAELTVVMWVRVDHLMQPLTGLLNVEPPNRWDNHRVDLVQAKKAFYEAPINLFRWEIGDTGRIFFNTHSGPVSHARHPNTRSQWNIHVTAEHVKPPFVGQWIQLAVVYDSTNQQVIQFLNGKVIDRRPANHQHPLLLGHLVIGNLNMTDPEEIAVESRDLFGAIDEVLVSSRAFSPDEIKRNWTVGKP